RTTNPGRGRCAELRGHRGWCRGTAPCRPSGTGWADRAHQPTYATGVEARGRRRARGRLPLLDPIVATTAPALVPRRGPVRAGAVFRAGARCWRRGLAGDRHERAAGAVHALVRPRAECVRRAMRRRQAGCVACPVTAHTSDLIGRVASPAAGAEAGMGPDFVVEPKEEVLLPFEGPAGL